MILYVLRINTGAREFGKTGDKLEFRECSGVRRFKGYEFYVLKKQAPWAIGEVQFPDAIEVVIKSGCMEAFSFYHGCLRFDGGQPERVSVGFQIEIAEIS